MPSPKIGSLPGFSDRSIRPEPSSAATRIINKVNLKSNFNFVAPGRTAAIRPGATVAQSGSGEGDVGFAAEGADRAVMDARAAVRTALLEDLPAERTELSTRRIRRGTVWFQKGPPVHLIRRVGRTFRIGTEPARNGRHCASARELAHRCFRCERHPELLRQLPDNRIVQLRPIPLLKHRKRRLLAPHLGCNNTLRKLRRTARILEFPAGFWT